MRLERGEDLVTPGSLLAGRDASPGLCRLRHIPADGRPVPLPPPPPPTGWAGLAPVGLMLGVWAAGLVVAALVWWALGRPKNDVQPDA